MKQAPSPNPMPRRKFIKAATTATAFAACERFAFGSNQVTEKAKRPNIVFVFSDEHRHCSLPFTEMAELSAPNMTRLSRQGTQFDNCCSTSPICVPYRGMLITGQWPHQSSCLSNDHFGDGDAIGIHAPTIAQTFNAAGYTTGYVGKWHLKEETVYNAGFDYFKHWLYGDEHWETRVRDVPSGEDYQTIEGYNATGMTDQAIEFIGENADGDAPFLLLLSINPPHWRWDDAPEEFLKLYPSDELPFRPNVVDNAKQGKIRHYYQHYHAHISAVDHELGRLMQALDHAGITDDTILIYTSDHGSSFGSNGVYNKGNPFEESVRVPFIVRWPERIPADRVADHNLGTIDLYPTLCGLAGITPPAHCGGQDFSSAFLGKPGPDPVSQLLMVNNFQRNYFRSRLQPGQRYDMNPFRGVRTKRYTYAVDVFGDWILYDNRKDTYQMRNLADDPDYAEIRAELADELSGWLAKAEDPFIPAEWTALSLPERIALENEYYSLADFQDQWERYIEITIAPYLEGASPSNRQKLSELARQTFDREFFGLYKALDNELNGRKRWTDLPADALRRRLATHEERYTEIFQARARELLGS